MSGPRALLCGAVIGALWAAMAVPLAAVALLFVFGLPTAPDVPAALVAGAAAGLTITWSRQRTAKRRRVLLATAAGLVLLFLAGAGRPFGMWMTESLMLQLLAAVAAVAATGAACEAAWSGIDPARLNRHNVERLVMRVLRGFGFVFFTVLVAVPFYVMAVTSLKTQAALLADPLDLAVDFALGLERLFSSYAELFQVFHFGRYVLVSSVVSVSTVVITLLCSIPGAYAVARLRFPGRSVMLRSVLLIYMVPAIVLVIPLYAVFSQLGLRDTLIGLLIVYPATTIPVALYMLQGYFRGIPQELEEAGLMDGCSRFGVILRITLPLSLPALASVALYVFMIAWNEFLFAFMFLDNPEIFTLSRAVVSLNSSEVPRQHLMAGAVIVTVPVLVLFLWFERFLVKGLTAGAVKG